MSITKKWEEYLSLNLNEDQERADQLFHEIIVETSRQLYENMMEDDDVADLVDEVSAEGMNGMMEADDDMDMDSPDMDMGDAEADMDDADMDMDDAEMDMDDADMDMDDAEADMDDADMDMGDEEDMGGDGEPATKDDIMNLEDKLDELMAEFEAMMHDQGAAEEEEGEEEEEEEEEESGVMESVQLKKVGGETYNKFGHMGDDGAQKKSPVAANSGAKGMASKPVKFSGDTESVPSSPKAPSSAAYHTKSEQNLPHAGKFMNVPDAAKNVAKGRGESAPKPKHETVKARSVVPESRVAKKRKV
jgi:hypothetical protein